MKLYNTLTRQIDELQTLKPNEVSLYTCGLTVYSQPHIGNWVGYIYWDVLQRALEALGYAVNRVQNITDVGHLVSDDDNGEDKMEKGAKAEGKTAWEVADKFIAVANHEGYELLGLIKPTLIRATDKIPEQIAFIQELEAKGFTYVITGEGIYFDTSKLDDYGKLARIDAKGLEAGSRVVFKNKRNVTDFALWKFSPTNQQRDMEWESPFADNDETNMTRMGFPGWHLECSVIAKEGLGEQVDIHTGGIDHIPIHHTNEIAQTESLTGKPFASMWVHNNHLKVDGGKMSKSLGNIYTLQNIQDKGFDLRAFKLMILSKGYHTEGNFTWEILESFQNLLNKWLKASALIHQERESSFSNLRDSLLESLQNNLDTADAITTLSAYFSTFDDSKHAPTTEDLTLIDELLGLNLAVEDITDHQKELLMQRLKAREDKDWSKSDEIRDELKAQGIGVKDTSGTQIWSRL